MNPKPAKPSISPSRRAAFDILCRVEAEGAYASVLVASLPERELAREDRALAQEITLGVLRHRKSLDYFIERYARRPIARMDLPVIVALRMGLYQLRHLSRIPDRAAVNESVNIVKGAGTRSAAGLVNAVLRNAARRLDEKPGEGIADPLERLAVEVSHPPWMLKRWIAQLGDDEAGELARANNELPRAAFRVNTLLASEDELLASLISESVTVQQSKIAPGAFIIERGEPAAVFDAVEKGLIYLQDEASQLVSLLLEPSSGASVLDLCAAPGSKTTHIAALAGNACWIVAADLYPHRLAALSATCRRLGASRVSPLALDATLELPIVESAQRFDRVLIDAPCSGTGTLRRNPEIKWRLAPSDIERLAKVQLGLLERGSEMVARGGRLVYSTCSMEVEENEEVINGFLAGNASFRLIRPGVNPDLITEAGMLRTFPHHHGTDGFFAAVLEKI